MVRGAAAVGAFIDYNKDIFRRVRNYTAVK